MFYTVTLNPALDYAVWVNKLEGSQIAADEAITPGGKGINVSIILKELGIESTALGFIAGFSGTELESRLRALEIGTLFTRVLDGNTRINIKIKSESETEINGKGPKITGNDVEAFLTGLDRVANEDTLILSGSIPYSLQDDIYNRILNRFTNKDASGNSGRKVRIVVDITGNSLLSALEYRPFLIKPNAAEIDNIHGSAFGSINEMVEYAKKLQYMGAANVLVTLGADGAVLVAEDGKIIRAAVPKGKVINTTGAGDSAVAGFLAGYDSDGSCETALRTAMAAGCATAFSKGLAQSMQIADLMNSIEII